MKTPTTRLILAVMLAPALGALGAEPGPGAGSMDPAVTAVQPSTEMPSAAAKPQGAAPQDYPLFAFSALGSSLEQTGHFGDLGWSEAQFNAFLDGMRAAYQGKAFSMDASAQRLSAEVARRIGEIAAQARPQESWASPRKGRLEGYMRDMERRLGLQQSASGLGYNVQPGKNGVRPRPGDTILVTVHATAADGTTRLAQLSAERISIRMDGMMPGLMEGLQMMTEGAEAVFVIPPSLSFGDNAWPDGVERGSPLVYWVTLHGVTAGAQP